MKTFYYLLIIPLSILVLVSNGQVQSKSVKGQVTDAQTRQSLPGVTILLKGTNRTIITDADGRFLLTLPGEPAFIVFSLVGYQTRELAIKDESFLPVVLEQKNRQLDEVLVEWEKAEEYATKIIKDGNYELVDWSTFLKNKNTKESIFELAYSTADQSAHFGSWSSVAYRNQFCPSPQLYNLLQSPVTGGDRKQLVKDNSTPTIQNYYVQLLYWRPEGDNPSYLFRLAEQYLIRAEARARKEGTDLTGALDDLNAVRKRAKLPNSSISTRTEMLRAIENERHVELALEPHRWFDLVRTEKAGDVIGVTDKSRWIFPIPFNDIAADKDLVQNAGY